MVVAVSDTHGSEGHRLAGRTLEAVREADLVVHAGDFTTATVLNAFEGESERFVGVYGNNDDATVCERLPAERVVEVGGLRIALVHGHAHDATALSLLGRQENVDLVVSGHSHRPAFDDSGPVALLNPGSHADPRWNRPAHAEIDVAPDGGDGSGGERERPRAVARTRWYRLRGVRASGDGAVNRRPNRNRPIGADRGPKCGRVHP